MFYITMFSKFGCNERSCTAESDRLRGIFAVGFFYCNEIIRSRLS